MTLVAKELKIQPMTPQQAQKTAWERTMDRQRGALFELGMHIYNPAFIASADYDAKIRRRHTQELATLRRLSSQYILMLGVVDTTKLSEPRKEIYQQLQGKQWFQATEVLLQKELLEELPPNHDGFLRSLTQRPDEIGGARVDRMVALARANFAVIPIFGVTKTDADGTAHQYTYEYVSWRQGPKSGAKGIVFVENEGKITHFITMRGEKFATGHMEDDLAGGFIEPSEEGVQGLLTKVMKRELEEEFGLPGIKLAKVVPLGSLNMDAGMTNNNPDVFAAVIDASEAQRISDTPVNPDVYELKSGPVIHPISQLQEIVARSKDAFLLSAVVKSEAAGLI